MTKKQIKHGIRILIQCLVLGLILSSPITRIFAISEFHPLDANVISVSRWDKAFKNIIKEEGGYSNDANDPGGETKWGISKTSYPHVNIKLLTQSQAEAIYKKDFWEPIKGDSLHDDELAVEVMEEAVNMGTSVAIKFLQTAVLVCGGKLDVDGKMGLITLEEVKKQDAKLLLACIKSQSMSYYMSLVHHTPALKKFLKGWFNRVLT